MASSNKQCQYLTYNGILKINSTFAVCVGPTFKIKFTLKRVGIKLYLYKRLHNVNIDETYSDVDDIQKDAINLMLSRPINFTQTFIHRKMILKLRKCVIKLNIIFC